MSVVITARLESDEEFRKKLLKVVKDYVSYARSTLDYYTADFDAAHDILMCYAPLTRKDYLKLAKGHPKRFILPITATHIHTMTTFLTASLFGTESPHTVNPGGPEDDASARVMNSLLRWNSAQQPEGMYQLGWFWIENALTYNRGILYDTFENIYKKQWQNVEEPVFDEVTGAQVYDEATLEPAVKLVPKKVKVKIGSFCRLQIVSPYDFYVDPTVPLYRMQSGRFAGHRISIPWVELKRRSELPEDDPMYVSPGAVERLKKKPQKGFMYPTAGTGSSGGDGDGTISSRTMYERGKTTGQADDRADTKDPGNVTVDELWVKLIPEDYEISEETDATIFQILVGNEQEVLSVNESTYEHEMFPYSVGEAHPSPFYQYSPSWVLMLKNIQDYVDYLKNRHQEAVSRTLGNVFIAKTNLIDVQDFEDPDKEGKFIAIKPEGNGQPINDIIRQVPIVDTTSNFLSEMQGFINFAESTSGANQGMQGQLSGDTTATEFAGTMQMATGRLSAIARLLSVQGLVPQTKRIVSNFQQFLDDEFVQRIEGEALIDITSGEPELVTINRDTIQGQFDYRAHDGTLPGADSKKVAALSRALDVSAQFPGVFMPSAGGLDPRKIILDLFRSGGMQVEKYRYSPEQIMQIQTAMAAHVASGGQIPGLPIGGQPQQGGPPGQPGPRPADPEQPPRPQSASPPQARPQNV